MLARASDTLAAEYYRLWAKVGTGPRADAEAQLVGIRGFARFVPQLKRLLFAYEATEIDFLPYEVHATRRSQQPVLKQPPKGPYSVQ